MIIHRLRIQRGFRHESHVNNDDCRNDGTHNVPAPVPHRDRPYDVHQSAIWILVDRRCTGNALGAEIREHLRIGTILHPIKEQEAGADRGLVVVIIDQTFPVASKYLHIASEMVIQRKTPVELSSPVEIPEIDVAPQEQ